MPNQDQGHTGTTLTAPSKVSRADLKTELQKIKEQPSLDAVPLSVPVEVLSDRAFEMLLYRLFQEGQGSHAQTQCGLGIVHDDTCLMQGTGDKGRDVALYRQGVAVGMVQCKHWGAPFTQPESLREICRFILAAKLHPELMPDAQDFTYVLALSGVANSKAVSLFHETAKVLADNKTLLSDAVKAARKNFKELQTLPYKESLAHAKEVLGKIKLKLLQRVDLAIWLHDCEAVFATFFQSRLVVDKVEVMKQLIEIKNALNGSFPIESLDHSQESSALAVARVNEPDGSHRLVTINDLYIQRTLEAEVDKKIANTQFASGEGTLIAVIAPAGFGKTSLLWGCHRRWRERGDTATLALSGTQLASLIRGPNYERVCHALLRHAETLRNGGIRFVVCLDTFDVLMHHEELSQPALKLVRQLVESGAALLLSTRPEEVADIKLDQLIPQSVKLFLSEYDTDEFGQALRSYCAVFYPGADATTQASLYALQLADLVALGRPAREVCLNPLTLRMLFELYAPAEVPENINSPQLYLRYYQERVQGDQRAGTPKSATKRKDLSQAAKQIALAMLNLRVPALTEQQSYHTMMHLNIDDSDLSELLSRHLLRRSAGRVEFFHQTFFEYIAGLELADQSSYAPDACATALLEQADDSFEFPIREHQLWHCAYWIRQKPDQMDLAIGQLLVQSHPGPWSAALRLHVMSENGYESARQYLLSEALHANADVLKRFCQLIHHLSPARVGEVYALIMACNQHRSWDVIQWQSQLLIWLAPLDWPRCKQLIEAHHFFDTLLEVAFNSGHVGPLIAEMLNGGLRTDPVFVLSTALRYLHSVRERETMLGFLAKCADQVDQVQASFLAAELLKWAQGSPAKKIGPLLGSASHCLGILWSRFPALCHVQGESESLKKRNDLRLSLRALIATDSTVLDNVRCALLQRLSLDLDTDALNILLHKFVAPLLHSPSTTHALYSLAIRQCEQLVYDLASQAPGEQASGDGKANVIYSFISTLKKLGICPSGVNEIIAQTPCEQWLGAPFLVHLLPIALTEGIAGAVQAMDSILNSARDFPHHLSVLRAGLPSLVQTPAHLDIVLRLAIADQSCQLAFAALEKIFEERTSRELLLPAALRQAQALRQLAVTAVQGSLSHNRQQAYRLLELMVREALIAKLDYPLVLQWVQKESTPLSTSAKAASVQLLVTNTSAEQAEQTLRELLAAAAHQPEKVSTQLIEQLQRAMAIKHMQLSHPLLQDVLNLALQDGATQSQASLVGRVMDAHLLQNEANRADQAALQLLNSALVQGFSSMQKRRLCHNLDKSFQRLYGQLTMPELIPHLHALRHMDPMLGRVVVVALCKSERTDREQWAQELMADQCVHRMLHTIVHEYRQYRWT